MKSHVPTSFRDLARHWTLQSFTITSTKKDRIVHPASLPKPIFSLGPYFTFVYDICESAYKFISPEVDFILGYSTEEIKNEGMSFADRTIHPDDKMSLLTLLVSAWNFIADKPAPIRIDYCISTDFRIRRSDGSYIRLLQQNCILHTDWAGNILQIYGICTDITHWKKNCDMTLTIKRNNGESHSIKAFQHAQHQRKLQHISPREREVIREICRGRSTTQISDRLHISPHTVSTHRKVILRKLGLKRTAALVRFATENRIA